MAFALLAALALASTQTKHEAAKNGAWEADPDLGLIHRFGYVNCDYGYYVAFPHGVIGMGDLPPSPNHGFLINLASVEIPSQIEAIVDTNNYIDVTNEYEVQDATKTSELVDRELDYWKERYPHAIVVSNRAARLGGLNGRRLVIKYKDHGQEMIEDLTVMMRERSIEYTISMVTPADKYEKNRPLLESILAGFHIVRIRNGQGECSNEWPPRYKALQITKSPNH
jgi:hypothetical protein